MASAVANRYARALADIILGPGSPLKPEDAAAQIRSVEQLLSESPELRNALQTPSIQVSRKRAVMGRLLDRLGVSPIVRNFVWVVVDRRRVAIMTEIREAFELLVDERIGFARADVTSAEALDDQRSSALAAGLEHITGKRMRMHFSVDPELLGGVTARIGSTLYDGSLRGQLQQLRRRLTEQPAAE